MFKRLILGLQKIDSMLLKTIGKLCQKELFQGFVFVLSSLL